MNCTFFYTSTIIILIVKEITILKDNIKLKKKIITNKHIDVDKPVSNRQSSKAYFSRNG